MGADIKLRVGSPNEFGENERDAFVNFVVKAGKIDAAPIKSLVSDAVALGMVYSNYDLIGSAALKRPNIAYRTSVFKKAGVESPEIYPFELGWVHVDEAFRSGGLAKKLASAVLEHTDGQGIYATTSSNAMSNILQGLGYNKAGNKYKSRDGKENLSLFIRTK